MSTDPKPGQRARITVEGKWDADDGYWWIAGTGDALAPRHVLAWEPLPDPMPEWVSTPGEYALVKGDVWQRGSRWYLIKDVAAGYTDDNFWAMGPVRLVPEDSAPDPDTGEQCEHGEFHACRDGDGALHCDWCGAAVCSHGEVKPHPWENPGECPGPARAEASAPDPDTGEQAL